LKIENPPITSSTMRFCVVTNCPTLHVEREHHHAVFP
jgi:hypothetical protein